MRIRADERRSAAVEGQQLDPEAASPTPSRAERIHEVRESLEREAAPETAEVEETPRRKARFSLGEARREAREVLGQLDELERALASARSAASAGPAPTAPLDDPICDPRGRHGRALWGEPSPYLEERMGGARTAAADLGRALDEIAARSGQLRTTVANLEDELTRASREIQFLRNEEPVAEPMPLPSTPVGARSEAATQARPKPARSAVAARPAAPAASFAQYTTERYNRSVGVLADRRTKIGGTMLVLAAAISAVLLVITYLSHDPTPPFFLAGLPVIWMIPVPFFVVSFRGTQRVLRTNPMNLEGGF